MADLEELAGRVEGLTGPSSEIDGEIALATGKLPAGAVVMGLMYAFVASNGERAVSFLPRYTASIDAAMTLVPEGWALSLAAGADDAHVMLVDDRVDPTRLPDVEAAAASIPLALTAAALRALSRTQGNQNG